MKRSLVQRLLDMPRTTYQQRHYAMNRPNLEPNRSAMDPEPGDGNALAQTFIQTRATSFSPELQPIQENATKRLRLSGWISSMYRDLERNFPIWSPTSSSPPPEYAQKLLRVAQMEMAKTRLREIPVAWMEYDEFVLVCGCGFSDPGRGVRVAKMLDESGHVVVLGDHVLLRPELVRKAIEGLMPINHPNDPTRKELEEMENERMVIEAIAVSQVRRELWYGLCFLGAQTAAFLRLTFWELTWDVMEPICFYLTSTYFMAGYAFFLRTSREPSFEGFFHSRIATKRKRIMDARGFDLRRYEELLRICSHGSSAVSQHST